MASTERHIARKNEEREPAKELAIRIPAQPRRISIRQSWLEERDRLLKQALSLPAIDTKEGFDRGGEILSAIGSAIDAVESMRVRVSKPFLMAAKAIKAASDAACEPLLEAKASLRAKLASFACDERRKAALEAKRKARETPKSQRKSFCPIRFRREPYPKSANVSVVSKLVYEIRDESLLPRELLSPDKTKIRAWLDANRGRLKASLANAQAYEDPSAPGLRLRLSAEIARR